MEKNITIAENELKRIVKESIIEVINEIKGNDSLLLEMPYSRNDYIVVLDTNARNAYIHFGKLFLYKDSTQDANGWVDEIVNKFTVPMLRAKVYVSDKAKEKAILNGYIFNFFGENYEDYQNQMEDFCSQSVYEVEKNAKKRGLEIPKHDDMKEAIEKGKEIIMSYGNAIKDVLKYNDQEQATQKLKEIVRSNVNNAFGLSV